MQKSPVHSPALNPSPEASGVITMAFDTTTMDHGATTTPGTPSKLPSLSISMPCYNNAGAIAQVVESCFAFLPTVAEDYEVFVVEDGGKDNSWEILLDLQKKFPKLKLERHEVNQGFGITISKVLLNRDLAYNALLPCDGQVLPEDLLPLIEGLKEADLVLGNRLERADDDTRKRNSKVYNRVIRFVSRKPVEDVNTVVVFRTEILEGMNLRARSAFVHAEFFLNLVKRGVPYVSVPMQHRESKTGKGSGGNRKVIMETIKELGLYLLGRFS